MGKAAAECANRKQEAKLVPQLTSEEAIQAAEAEGLLLVRSNCSSGYRAVQYRPHNGRCGKSYAEANPYKVNVNVNGTQKVLGTFKTAEQAALCYSRHIGRVRGGSSNSQQLA